MSKWIKDKYVKYFEYFKPDHILFSRVLLLIAALAYILYGILYRSQLKLPDPMPFTTRVTAATIFIGLFIFSFISKKVKKRLYRLTWIITFFAICHVILCAYQSNFALNYAFSLLTVILITNLIFRSDRLQRWGNVIVVALTILAVYQLEDPRVNKLIYSFSFAALAAASYLIGKLKLKAEHRLEQVTREYRTIINNVQDAVFLINIEDDNYYFYRFNPIFAQSMGFTEDELRGKSLCQIYDKTDCERIKNKFERCLQKKETINYEEKSTLYGHTVHWHTKLSPVIRRGKVVQIVGVSRDITRRKEAEAKIKQLTFHDSLTGLYNRAYFQQELERYNTERQLPLSIIIGDVNGLKLANDAFGHGTGDDLLVKIADIIQNCCRQEDLVARWGGDEFVILLPQTNNEDVKKVKNRIKSAVKDLKADPVKPSVALGYATKTDPKQDIKDIFQEAEDWMYKNKLNESRNIHGDIITSLKESFFEKTNETKNHCHRLHQMAEKLGREIGLEEHQLNNLVLLAELHDLGKVGISEKILKKEGPLNEEEWHEIRRHSEIGYQIASSSPELSGVAEDILSHHEQWNGNGYPRGLKGEEIPLAARIISVVDAYDVMTSDRPYHKAYSKEKAVRELKKEAGRQFDPEIVDIFIEKVINK